MQEPCRDANENCAFWSNDGECEINPVYMLDFCRLSCNACQVTLTVGTVQRWRFQMGTKMCSVRR